MYWGPVNCDLSSADGAIPLQRNWHTIAVMPVQCTKKQNKNSKPKFCHYYTDVWLENASLCCSDTIILWCICKVFLLILKSKQTSYKKQFTKKKQCISLSKKSNNGWFTSQYSLNNVKMWKAIKICYLHITAPSLACQEVSFPTHICNKSNKNELHVPYRNDDHNTLSYEQDRHIGKQGVPDLFQCSLEFQGLIRFSHLFMDLPLGAYGVAHHTSEKVIKKKLTLNSIMLLYVFKKSMLSNCNVPFAQQS